MEKLRYRLFPLLNQKGYEGPGLSSELIKGRKVHTFDFKKNSSKGEWLVLAVHVKTSERPAFEIYGGLVPSEGAKLLCPEELIPAEKVTADMLATRTFLQSHPRKGSAPFRPSAFSLWLNKEKAVENVVNAACAKLPRLLAFIEHQVPSPDVWSFFNRV